MPPEIAALLGGASRDLPRHTRVEPAASEDAVEAAEPAPAEVAAERALAIAVRADEGELEYDADLSQYEPLTLGGPASEWLAMLKTSAEFVAELHAAGRAHGELRVGMLLLQKGRLAVVVPPPGVDAASLLAARLRSGAHPTEVAYAAPEVAHGSPATPASDVYSIAALAFAAVGGRAPLALVDAITRLSHLGDDVAETLIAALDARPEQRPSASALARALADAVSPQRVVEAGGGARAEGASILGAALIVGAVAVFTGVFGLALARWGQVGLVARLSAFSVFTLAVFGAGAALLRLGNRRSGVGLSVLAAQLLWADVWLLLASSGLEQSYAAWAIAGAAIGALQCALAARLGWVVMAAFGAFAFTVSAVTLGLFLPIGTGLGPPAFAAAVALLMFTAELLLSRWSATTAAFSIASGFWILASAVVSLFPLARGELFALAWPYLLIAATLALSAGVRARAEVLRIAALSLLVAAPSAQALVLIDRDFSVLVTALVSLAIALGIARAGQSGWSLASAITAAGWSTASMFMALKSDAPLASIGVYALVAVVALVARFANRWRALVAARVLSFSAAGMLLVAPSVQALLFRERQAVAAAIALLGVALVAFAARTPGLRADRERAAVAIGLSAAIVGPTALALLACANRTAAELGEQASFGEAPRFTYLALCVVVSGLLFALALSSTTLRREHRRALELGALTVGAGVAALLSLPVAREDLFYSSLALVLGGAGLTVALLRWRLVLALASATVVLLVLCVQYFAKLAGALHWGLLAVGFGLIVLIFATLFERKLKQLLPEWSRWD